MALHTFRLHKNIDTILYDRAAIQNSTRRRRKPHHVCPYTQLRFSTRRAKRSTRQLPNNFYDIYSQAIRHNTTQQLRQPTHHIQYARRTLCKRQPFGLHQAANLTQQRHQSCATPLLILCITHSHSPIRATYGSTYCFVGLLQNTFQRPPRLSIAPDTTSSTAITTTII